MAGEVKILFDGLKKFKESIRAIDKTYVLVGIPEEKAAREDSEEGFDNMSNAAIGYIQENGSDINNIPPRPFLVPGIKKAQKEIALRMEKAVKVAFSDSKAVTKLYAQAGMIAANSAKQIITDQTNFTPLAQSTLDAREAEGFKGTKALIRTAQLRNSITYVVGVK